MAAFSIALGGFTSLSGSVQYGGTVGLVCSLPSSAVNSPLLSGASPLTSSRQFFGLRRCRFVGNTTSNSFSNLSNTLTIQCQSVEEQLGDLRAQVDSLDGKIDFIQERIDTLHRQGMHEQAYEYKDGQDFLIEQRYGVIEKIQKLERGVDPDVEEEEDLSVYSANDVKKMIEEVKLLEKKIENLQVTAEFMRSNGFDTGRFERFAKIAEVTKTTLINRIKSIAQSRS